MNLRLKEQKIEIKQNLIISFFFLSSLMSRFYLEFLLIISFFMYESTVLIPKYLKTGTVNERIWAINKLPFPDNSEGNKKCFKKILKSISSFTQEVNDPLFACYYREISMHTMTDYDELLYIFPVLCILVDFNLQWTKILFYFCSSVSDQRVVIEIFNKVGELLQQNLNNIASQRIAAILNGLYVSNRPPPYEYAETLIKFPQILKFSMHNFLPMAERSYPAEKFLNLLNQILVLPIEDTLIIGLLNCQEIPSNATTILQNLFAQDYTTDLNCLAFMRNNRLAEKHKIISLKNLIAQAAKSQAITTDPDAYVTFFNDVCWRAEAADIGILFRVMEIRCVKQTLKVIPSAIKIPNLVTPVLDFMCQKETITYINEWCDAYEAIIPKIKEHSIKRLTDLLIEVLSTEIVHGHYSMNNGQKIFQLTSTVRKPIKTWKEIGRMILSLSHMAKVEYMPIIHSALKVHSYPLIDVVIIFLNSLKDQSYKVLEFLRYYYRGKSWEQRIFIKLSLGLLSSKDCKLAIPEIHGMLVNLASDLNCIDEVRTSAMKALQKLVDMTNNDKYLKSVISDSLLRLGSLPEMPQIARERRPASFVCTTSIMEHHIRQSRLLMKRSASTERNAPFSKRRRYSSPGYQNMQSTDSLPKLLK